MGTELDNKTILLTGGTGSFGTKFIQVALTEHNPKVIRVYSRSELQQWTLKKNLPALLPLIDTESKVRFLIGDVRDKDRLKRATENVDIIVHAAALKQVPICEYNPREAVYTNILGTQNIIDCAIDNNVPNALLISSDKSVAACNLYGTTKAVAEKLFIQGNVYGKTRFSCTRYGNVVGSHASIVPLFLEQEKSNELTITDERMTRFWITLYQGVSFSINCLSMMKGGEIFVPFIPSMKVIDLAKVIAPNAKIKKVGIRPGEKLHELLITEEEARHAKKYDDVIIIYPEFPFWGQDQYLDLTGEKLPDGFKFSSDTNPSWLTQDDLRKMIQEFMK